MIGQTMQLFVSWTLNGNQVMMGLAGVALGATGIALGLRWWIHRRAEQLTTTNNGSSLERKHQDIEIYQHSGSLRLIGAICAITLSGIILAWTQWDSDYSLAMGDLETPEELLMEPPVVAPQPPALPPPPPPKHIFVATDIPDIETPEQPDRTEDPVPVYDPNNNTGTSGTGDPTPVKPIVVEPEPEQPKEDNTIIFMAEEMPRFPGCDDVKMTKEEKKACSEKKMLEFIYSKVKYPETASSVGIEGTAVVSFVVEKDGTLSQITLVKDPGAGLGREALRVANKMAELATPWTPGKQQGRPVRVKYNMPIKFKLANK